MKIRGPRDVLVALFTLRGKLSNTPSRQGALEDELRQGGRVQQGFDLDRAQSRHLALAEAALATLTLTAEELEVVDLRYQPDARMTGAETYERIVPSGDVPSSTDGAGEEVIPGTARDHAGEPIPGYTKVVGRRARMPSYQEIGQRVGLSETQVRRRVQSALGKVREWIDRVREGGEEST